MKLRMKMLVVFSVLTGLALLIVSIAGYLFAASYFTKSINSEMKALFNGHVTKFDGWLIGKAQILETTAGTLIRLTESVDNFPNKYLNGYQLGDKEIFDIYLGTSEGKTVFGDGWVPGPDYDPRRRPWYIQAVDSNKLIFTDPYIDAKTYKLVVSVALPLKDINGKLLGVIAEDIMLDTIIDTTKSISLNGHGYAVLLDSKGNILVHPDAELVSKNVFEAGDYWPEMFKEIFPQEDGFVTYQYQGKEKMMFYQKIPSTGWILGVTVETDVLYQPLKELKMFVSGFTVVIIGSILLVTGLLARQLTRPLSDLSQKAQLVSNGDLTVRADVCGRDEIAELSLSFNEMVAALQEQREALEQSKEYLYRTVVDFSSDVAFWYNPVGELVYISPNCERLTGYNDEEFYANPRLLNEIVHKDDQQNWLSYLEKVFSSPDSLLAPIDFRINTKNGDLRWMSHICRPIYNEDNEFLGIRGSHSDCTDRKVAEEKMLYLSRHDLLTGLYNRNFFEQQMQCYRLEPDCALSIIICDVDGLKIINDTFGHERGDALLVAVADVIKKSVPENAMAARVGGDEFVILLSSGDSKEIKQICQDIVNSIKKYNKNNSNLPISISIGFATSHDDGINNVTQLYKQADDNMYRKKLHQSKSAHSNIVATLVKTIEARDFGTEKHASRMQDLIVLLGQECGFSEANMADLRLFAQFHDLGKIGTPDHILFKPGSLTDEERAVMNRHSEIGYRIAQAAPDLMPIADWILRHHEWWNGKGYPLGIKGEEIPLPCRILAIIDAYDAMTSDRPYRKALSHEEAVAELKRCAGKQFDPNLVEKFVSSM